MKSQTKKGFTLVELLVVIAIIAILAVAVILTLNPAELLRQSRDTTRVSDLNTLKSAIALYITDQSSASNYSLGNTGAAAGTMICYESISAATPSSTCGGTGAGQVLFPSRGAGVVTSSASRLVDGTGWLPVKFNLVTSGAPVGNLPADPTNNTQFYYAYIASSSANTFKLGAVLESVKYSASGTSDLASTDGGTSPNWYETGTNLAL